MLAKFIARFLGLWSRRALPVPFHGRFDDEDYDVQPLSGGNISISIYLPRARMLIQPACFRKSEDSDFWSVTFKWFSGKENTENEDVVTIQGGLSGSNWLQTHRKIVENHGFFRYLSTKQLPWSANIGGWIHPLFNMVAASVDVGFNTDKIEAIFSGENVRVNKVFAKQVVNLMLHLRNEATGQEVADVLQRRPWAKATENAIDVDGELVTFEFSSCLVDADEAAGTLGNLDVMVRTTPSLPPDKLIDNLCLGALGYDELLRASAYGQIEGGFELNFALAELASRLGFDADRAREWMHETVNTLQEVDISWGATKETKLATLRCVRAIPISGNIPDEQRQAIVLERVEKDVHEIASTYPDKDLRILLEVIASESGVHPARIDLDNGLRNPPMSFDSVDVVELIITIEDMFGATISDQVFRDFDNPSPRQLCQIIKERKTA